MAAQVGTREAAFDANLALKPDLILLDFQLADGTTTNAIQKLIDTAHRPKVLLLSSFAAPANVFASLDAGASGYLLKSSPAGEVLAAIRTVSAGGTAYASELQEMSARPTRVAALTRRELDVLSMIAQGLSNEGIAQKLNLSLGTVKSHVHNLLEKLGTHSRSEALACARSRGIIAS